MNSQVNAFQRNFVHEVKRAEEMLRKISLFAAEIQLVNDDGAKILIQRDSEPIVELQLDELEVSITTRYELPQYTQKDTENIREKLTIFRFDF